ncbi:GyrI-like domain-containing protein [Flavobacterium sp. MK4S-17]|uniref:GyrI-like domain-containing protein n=1 Tax=Flavobacterium sp. MK4S-17 TaxID=2543737 RepID=UPI00135CEEED|nr:GyrI-like domain-containing protein [Flavobacterium sp. MK4S-17]
MNNLETIYLTGIALKEKTTNENNQAMQDCGRLWQEFESKGYFSKIDNKLENKIYAVYYDYEGDHTKPYSYFIGCRVAAGSLAPEGMENIVIPPGNYKIITAKGKMPDCVADAWRTIWNSDIKRAYKADFEIYDGESFDWNNAEIAIFISVEQ